ncbi:hypothetical protein [Streptomyces tauricus]|uniref:hypothetical protein n=1 Tax=Streptomyces tauricus TaxID=68274 RepID=UPI00382D8484
MGGSHGFVEALAVLEAVVELSEQTIDEVPLSRRVPVTVLVATPVVVPFDTW